MLFSRDSCQLRNLWRKFMAQASIKFQIILFQLNALNSFYISAPRFAEQDKWLYQSERTTKAGRNYRRRQFGGSSFAHPFCWRTGAKRF